MFCLPGLSGYGRNKLGAEVAELADALDSGSSARKGVGVQVPPSAPLILQNLAGLTLFFPNSFTCLMLAQVWGGFADARRTALDDPGLNEQSKRSSRSFVGFVVTAWGCTTRY